MVDVVLLPSDIDKELYQKICETASQQNIGTITLQRNILCSIFHIPENHSAKTQHLLLHQALTEKYTELNIPVRSCIRACLREYFGLPVLEKEKKVAPAKPMLPLKQNDNRFQILSVLVTADAATSRDIADIISLSFIQVNGVLRNSSHYFESFRIPYDKRYWWRATEQGRQDYYAIVGEVKTVKESKLESQKFALQEMREGAIQERIAQEKKIREPKIKEKKILESKIKEKKIREPKIKEKKILEPKIKEKKIRVRSHERIIQIEARKEKIRQLEREKAERKAEREERKKIDRDKIAVARRECREYIEMQERLREQERELQRAQKEKQAKEQEARKEEKRKAREQEKAKRKQKQVSQNVQRAVQRAFVAVQKEQKVAQKAEQKLTWEEKKRIRDELSKQRVELRLKQEAEAREAKKKEERERIERIEQARERKPQYLFKVTQEKVIREQEKIVQAREEPILSLICDIRKAEEREEAKTKTREYIELQHRVIQQRKAEKEQRKLAREEAAKATKAQKAKERAEAKAKKETKKAQKPTVTVKRKQRKSVCNFKLLSVLAAADDDILLWELTHLVGFSQIHCQISIRKLWTSGYVEKVDSGRGNLWRITESGRQEQSRLTEIFGVVLVEKREKPIVRTEAHRQYLFQLEQREAKKAEKEVIRLKEMKVIESFKTDRELRTNESGIQKYFLYDPNSPIDMEIVKRVNEHPRPEYQCRRILCKRLALSCSANYRDVDQVIEIKLLDRCKKKGINRNEFVRQLFCSHFNIKMEVTS